MSEYLRTLQANVFFLVLALYALSFQIINFYVWWFDWRIIIKNKNIIHLCLFLSTDFKLLFCDLCVDGDRQIWITTLTFVIYWLKSRIATLTTKINIELDGWDRLVIFAAPPSSNNKIPGNGGLLSFPFTKATQTYLTISRLFIKRNI